MLVSLIKYEFMRRWRVLRYVLLVFILIETLLLIASEVLLTRSAMINIAPHLSEKSYLGLQTLILFVYIAIDLIIIIVPTIEGAIGYEREISGKQAPIELMVPIPAWKKVASKIITITALNVFFQIIIGAFMFFYFIAITRMAGDKGDGILETIKTGFLNPSVFIMLIFASVSVFVLLMFCICVAKWITNRYHLSNLISLLVFVIYSILYVFLSIQTEAYPIATFDMSGTVMSLSTIILDIVATCILFFLTSFIMENKIES